LEAYRKQVLALSTHRNTLPDGDGHLLAVTTGPLLIVVSISEGLVNSLHRDA
jgi:hypothetical protein